jgi:hypothetical protein
MGKKLWATNGHEIAMEFFKKGINLKACPN